ncbi:MAG: hypothetical protein ACI9BO_000994 [Zhongshania sp.]|jgi:hypothetical protein
MAAEERGGFHAYGNMTALCVEPALNKLQTTHTVNFDLAPMGDRGGADWSRKITVQPDKGELALIAATLLGYRPDIKLARPDKHLLIARQPNQLYMTGGPARKLALPLGPAEAFQLSTVIMHCMTKNYPFVDSQTIVAMLRGSCTYK